ncbi:MAG: toll/interleukin-1 receptor domain-containing protein [Fimbriimonadaceae bacterium]|nr:toll/interleukin-1 receptor domain-containing protein [Fimbriimonadaceae bacterium]
MAHLLFLSHAGADTERALWLAAAIEASPKAQAAGLKVWLDQRPDGPHRLQASTPWQDQLELTATRKALHSASTTLQANNYTTWPSQNASYPARSWSNENTAVVAPRWAAQIGLQEPHCHNSFCSSMFLSLASNITNAGQ